MIDLGRLARDLGMIARRRAEQRPSANDWNETADSSGTSNSNGASDSNDALTRSAFSSMLFDLEGAEILEVDGEQAFAVRRDVEELYPEGGVTQEMQGAIERTLAADEEGPRELRDVVVLDLETAGFWGYPLFVSALLFEEDGRLQTLQLMTRTYAEESAVVRATVQILRGRSHLVTFNGKSFDVPFLSERAAYHAVDFDKHALQHRDLLHPARREYRGYFPNCKLQTLERMLLGIRRIGDISSAEIPAVFHEFIATGRIERVRDVLHHSRMDLISTALLMGKLGAGLTSSGASSPAKS